ncbi:DMP19 family protein [Kordia sp.]|uniref:DMP19 family protein n=1 Tax=Kordia sp. TaxID=1965332 RepID=UPI003B5B78F1
MLSSVTKGPKTLHFYTEVENKDLDEISKIESIPDQFWKLQDLMFNGIEFPEGDFEEHWKKLTKEQKTVLTLGHLISQTDNGGIWQFFFNKPSYCICGVEALYEVNPTSALASRYEAVLKEFITMLNGDAFTQICEVWDDESIEFETRWKTFKEGEKHLPSAEKFQKLFYDEQFKGWLYRDIVKYINQNLGRCLKIKGIEQKKMKKKEAIPHFTNFLLETYKQEPTEVSVYYTGRVTLDRQPTQLFLMKFKMPDGYESIGITGNFTYVLPEISMEDINRMYKRFHKQELVNIFHGCHLAHQELEKNANAAILDEKKWKETLKKLQDKSNSQIPVNIKNIRYFEIGNDCIFIYDGDLFYNSDKVPFPSDISNLELSSVVSKEKKGNYTGELNMTFMTFYSDNPSFGRMDRSAPVKGKYTLYDVLGDKNKLLKDNAWGF